MPGLIMQCLWTDVKHLGYSQQPAVFSTVCLCEDALSQAALGPQPSASRFNVSRLAECLGLMLS